jgi:cytochrome c oxidase subunit 2
MKISRLFVAVFFGGALGALGCGVAVAGTQNAVATAETSPVIVTASDFKFAPAEITVHVNQPVTLQLSATEGVHGFVSSDLGIPQTMLMPGAKNTVKFTPTKAGTYTIHCSVMCGPGHGDMTFVIHVVS